MRHVKIVATIGPASASAEQLSQLVDAGIDVARFNMSHGTSDWHRTTIKRLRQLSLSRQVPLAILIDLAGPKIRVGDLPQEGIRLSRDQRVFLVTRMSPPPMSGELASRLVLPIELDAFPTGLNAEQIVLIDDGNVRLQVHSHRSDRVDCTVLVGGVVTSHKGVNFPGLPLEIPGFTGKDAGDLLIAIEEEADYVALSFVRRPADIRAVRKALADRSSSLPVIAKIERPEAIASLEDILDQADGVMIARGDLALEMSPEEVPLLQKRIIVRANQLGKPVITATQMLQSMTRSPLPTRAEASDVANAVLDGTDAVMLSAETSTGAYPLDAVRVMDRIIRKTESEMFRLRPASSSSIETALTTPAAVCHAAVSLARTVAARAIVVFTESGHTALTLSSNRPSVPIFALTPSESVAARLALVWGVVPLTFPHIDDTDQRIQQAQTRLKELGMLNAGQLVVIVTGERLGSSMGTNLVKVQSVF